jgi:hypothetical protein
MASSAMKPLETDIDFHTRYASVHHRASAWAYELERARLALTVSKDRDDKARIKQEMLDLRGRLDDAESEIADLRELERKWRESGEEPDFDRGRYPAMFSHEYWQQKFIDVRLTNEREERRRQREEQQSELQG